MTTETTYSVWVNSPSYDGPRKFTGVVEVIEYPNRIEIYYPDWHEYAEGEVIRVRQDNIEEKPPVAGFELLVYPTDRIADVVDALRGSAGDVKGARADGTQVETGGERILWLRREMP